MIKVLFKTPTKIVQHGEDCEVLTCFAIHHIEQGYYTRLFFGKDDNCLVPNIKIKSIEFIQPNEL